MNRLFFIASFFWLTGSSAQYANDWIDYSQTYYTFKVWQNYIYKLDYNTLQNAGVPVASIAPEAYQLFAFEKEQPILVEDGGDGSFDAGDYILFYGQKNNSWKDSSLYDSPDFIANKYYPHYNDTIHYFLSWNTSGTNQRIQEETDVNFAAYTPRPYFIKNSYKEYHQRYLEGHKIAGISYSRYVKGEGWFSNSYSAFSGTGYLDTDIPTTNIYTGAGAPIVVGEAVSAGASNAQHVGLGNHHLQLRYGVSNNLLVDTVYSGYDLIKLNFQLSPTELSAPTTKIRHQAINDLSALSDYQSVAYAELKYPHTTNLENTAYYQMIVPFHSTENKTRYDFTNFNATDPIAFTIDGEVLKIPVQETSGTYQLLVPNKSDGSDRELVILDESQVYSITDLNAVNGNGSFINYTTMNFENAYIIVSGDLLMSSAQGYANYRSSFAGGSYSTVLLNERELCYQFGGGIDKHAIGIRDFVKYAYENTTVKPSHLFLIGKGIREGNESVSSPLGTRQNPTSYEESIVPAWGYPSSDVLLTANLSGNGLEPLIPTGRLAAKSNQEVTTYLNKMIEFEQNQDPNAVYNVPAKLWQKQILHFGGGATSYEQFQFKNYLAHYEQTLEGLEFGGNVTSFYKTVSDPINPTTLYEVTDYINDGVSIMTFFGHASADGFDQNVDNPANWNNKGKYPVVVGNACLTGNVFEPTSYSPSEEYILIEDKGAIAFLSNVKQAFSGSLHQFSNQLFIQIGKDNYGGTLGESFKNTLYLINQGIVGFGLENAITQMCLHGDPALRVNPHEKPELEVNGSSIFITPDDINLSVDSIDVNVVLYNLGRATDDTIAIEMSRKFPNNGGDSLYTKLVAGSYYIDTIVFTIPLYNNIGIGLNEFSVSVDIPSFIDEQYDEVGNNQISKQVFFDVDGIYPVWPYKFAVVPNDTVTLKGSTVNPFADIATYRFEVDTTDLFNSPEHRYFTQASLGGVVEVGYDQWLNVNSNTNDPLILEDSMVYFWRVSAVDTGYYWIESSFQHIPGKTGWGQEHFFQFKNNDFLFLNYDRNIRKRLFGPSFKTIECDVYGAATSFLETAFTLYRINGEIAEYNFCNIDPKLIVAVVDPTTLEPWGTRNGTDNPDHDFGNSNDNGGCRPRVENHFVFEQNDPVQMDAFDNMIANEIPNGYYILIYTARYADYSEWDADNFATFASLGSDSIHSGQTNDRPFILFTKKGNTLGTSVSVKNGGTDEVYGEFINSFISYGDTLWGFDYYGAETSPLIGPAQDWETLYWKLDSMESPTADSTRILLYGVQWAGSKSLLIDTLVAPHDSIVNLGGIVDAATYPFIQLNTQQWDTSGFTPSQLDSWHVLYQDVPEAALNGSAGVYFLPGDSLYEGQDIAVAFDVDNISDLPMDSLLINYWIEDADHVLQPIPYPRQDSLRVGQTIRDTLHINTVGKSGLNSLWVEVNPYVTNHQKDQLEKYHFNNLGQIPFRVVGDDENPILDVTFNGYHILNGDIVNPKSEVIITLKDDNPHLLMNEEADTANFGIYLTSPDGIQKRLNFRNSLGEPLMEWIPADASSKKFKIIYQGDFEQNGKYRLLVQGVDNSGNISGDFDYDIEFEVDHNSSITNLMNYPNPFTTSTRFVFTLTGASIPDEFTIQIMNVSGTVVREITKEELGNIQIGRNITEFEWNGTDEYGDRLARGVYLYRVIVKMNGETLEHRDSGADEYFTKSFGKMYLL
ncbi:MAG: C25 family cysteine peptidase [Crocinitomicaceae bacterium]